MKSFQECMTEYKLQLEKGAIQQAYRGLMAYIMELRTHLMKRHPEYSVPGTIYYGYMDMTYFAVVPPSLAARKLKIAIVFLHEAFRFEVWLAGVNRQIQKKYWRLLNDRGWDRYPLVEPAKGVDAIVEHILVDNPDFSDTDGLTRRIEAETERFIEEVERFLSNK